MTEVIIDKGVGVNSPISIMLAYHNTPVGVNTVTQLNIVRVVYVTPSSQI